MAMTNADTLLLNIKLLCINLSVGILWEYYTLSLAFECLPHLGVVLTANWICYFDSFLMLYFLTRGYD